MAHEPFPDIRTGGFKDCVVDFTGRECFFWSILTPLGCIQLESPQKGSFMMAITLNRNDPMNWNELVTYSSITLVFQLEIKVALIFAKMF